MFVHNHRVYNTNSETQCKLRTLSNYDYIKVGSPLVKKKKVLSGE